MCWLPIDQPLLLPGDSTLSRTPSPCSVAQLVAFRLRRVGDQMEKSWTAGNSACGPEDTLVRFGGKGHVRSALRSFAALVLFFTRQHL